MINRPEVEGVVGVLRGIGSPVRWVILNHLALGPCVVGALIEATGESQSTVSQHLHLLHQLGLVQCKKRPAAQDENEQPAAADRQYLQDPKAINSSTITIYLMIEFSV